MRVLLRTGEARTNHQGLDLTSSPPSSPSSCEIDYEEQLQEDTFLVPEIADPTSPEPAVPAVPPKPASAADNSNNNNNNSTPLTKKRPRSPDSKPPARKTLFAMTGGRREIPAAWENSSNKRGDDSYDDDDDNNLRQHPDPLENEPPVFDNHHHAAAQITLSPAAAKSDHYYYANDSTSSCTSNSEPEHDVPVHKKKKQPGNNSTSIATMMTSPSNLAFIQMLKQKRGLEIVPQEGDGNCLFRAVSLQVYGDAEQHQEVRQRCLDFMERDPEHFAPFVVLDDVDTLPPAGGDPSNSKDAFLAYIARKRHDGVHGNNPEIQAISELYNRPVEVFTPERGDATPLNIFQTAYKTTDVPIRLSYHDGNHYNAVIDPLVPTAGLGLGLPGLQPGLADKLQVAAAVAESDHLADELELERALEASKQDELWYAMKQSSSSSTGDHDKMEAMMSHHEMYNNASKFLGLNDLDDVNYQLEQKVLANSLESFRRQEHGRKQRASPSGRRQQHQSSPTLPVFGDHSTTVAASAAAAPADDTTFPNVASATSAVASAVAAASMPDHDTTAASDSTNHHYHPLGSADEYPQTVQELVMNGFELRKVVHAYELIGDNFDDLLAFLISNNA